LAWAGVRAISLGIVPGTQAWAFDAKAARPTGSHLPAIQPTPLPPIDPIAPAYPPPAVTGGFAVAPSPPGYPAYAPYPVYVPAPAMSAGRSSPPQIVYLDRPPSIPAEINVYGGGSPSFAQSTPPVFAPVPATAPERQSTPSLAGLKVPKLPDRLSISSWATMRKQTGSDSLANGGLLGGSQAGARLLWQFDPHLSASLRASSPINSQRGVEAAIGIRYQPLASLPVAFTLERRHAFRDYGQSAFALFGEGGLYGRRLPWGSSLDGYLQAGVVDFNHADWFVDGQAAVTRPVWRNLSAGVGVWGGAQPGLSRLDVGPRASLRIGARMRLHLDYRYKLLGNADPGSGTVVTLAGDF